MRAILIAHRKGESTHMRDGKTQPTSNRPYNFTAPTHDPLRGWHRGALLIVALALVSGLLLWLGQLAGAALLLLAGLLLHALRQRDRRARALARQIAAGRLDTKIEVGSGAWGDLSHAVNGLMQEQRVQVRLRTVLPTPLPAEALQRSWRDRDANTIVPLVLSLAIGQALTGLLPGLGYCVLGAPVEEAIQLQQLAHQMGQHGLISGEGVYYARRQADGPVWQPTDLRIPAPNRGAQVVYTHVEHAT
jgi:hypothetical protein